MKLQNKVALVTGATSGIGKAIAARFAAEGARVAVNHSRKPESAKRAADQVATFPTKGLTVGADVSIREDVEGMFRDVLEAFGKIDVIVNNAGIEIQRPFLEITDEEWNRVLGVNLFGAFVVTQTGVRSMIQQGSGGKIINVSSVHEDIPFPGYTPYCVSKGGMRMLARNLAIELAPHRINVNNIAPGAIATPINQQVLEDSEQTRNALSEIPWGRFGTPEEVASLAVYLASDESEYVTGSTFYIDGGLTQQVTRY